MTRAELELGDERFVLEAQRVVDAGFTRIMTWLAEADSDVPPLDVGVSELRVLDTALAQAYTEPPEELSEAELIAQMEENGIGTDASIASHIENIVVRNYVQVDERTRRLTPTRLGVALVHGFLKIDADQVLPRVRAHIERLIDLIAKEEASFDVVVPHALRLFRDKFDYFVRHIEKMDELVDAVFGGAPPVDDDPDGPPKEVKGQKLPKLKTRCGNCRRYMQYISRKPVRLYCSQCEQTYRLPQNGNIRLYKGVTCPLDNFELVLYTTAAGKTFPVCPSCFDHPVLDEQPVHVGCTQCPHPTCPQSLASVGIWPCASCDFGTLVLDKSSG